MQQFRIIVFTFILFGSTLCFGQKKILQAVSSNEKITIDGKLDEISWINTPFAKDFFSFEPENGTLEPKNQRSEVKIIYNDNAIYIGAILYDDSPNKIQKEITQRDNFGTSDLFGVFINGFNDGQQDFRFFVSAAGVQMDCLATELKEDFTWDAIWNSEVKITDFGWVVEMEIPYAALRFSTKEKQIWGINFFREIRRDRQKYTWSLVDRAIGSVINQAGILEGIENIKTPTRLFFIPYTSAYVESFENNTESQFKIGMDIKYGINDSFTLDAILIPDFGQAAFDNVILNLGPFEQQFNENRPFFTEGTDLFNKGNLLYTRRIGGPPTNRPNIGVDEVVSEKTNSVNLINAVKISGRTAEGLGIGFLNAITEETFATITNTVTNESRKELVEPLTNYNVLVFDQRFNQNSSVSFVNTNVTRFGNFRDANVTGIIYNINSADNKFNISGDLKMTSIYDSEEPNGYSSYFSIGKTYGKSRYSLATNYVSENFEINDLGINFVTNYQNLYANYNYRILNPSKYFNSFRVSTDLYMEFENTTGLTQTMWLDVSVNSSTLKNDFVGYGFIINPKSTYNFYEPRERGRYLAIPASGSANVYFSSNYNRKFALDIGPTFGVFDQENRNFYELNVSPRYRFSDRFTLIYQFNYLQQNSDIGWVDQVDADIIMAERDRLTITNGLTGKYAISNKMTLNLTSRYYWSIAENINFYSLSNDGSFEIYPSYNLNKDSNFNIWNFDLTYSWWFAPGSEIRALYRNNAQNLTNVIDEDFGSNANNLLENNLRHVFSVSFRYFIDYNKAKNWVKKG
jgi:hypothetical protein